MALILDTGPIVALLDAGDTNHSRCVAMVATVAEDLVVPAFVLVEVDYWLRKAGRTEAWSALVEDIVAGSYRLHHPSHDELQRASELELEYESLRLGIVDASVIALCERLGEPKVATLDRRDFGPVRPRHCEALHLLPD